MKKKIKVLVPLLALLGQPTLYCADNAQEKARNLIMILDVHNVEGNWKAGAMMQRLIPALVQKAAPIVISPSLWYNFIVHRNWFAESSYKRELQSNPGRVLDSLSGTNMLDFICYATPFDPNEWVMKKISSIAYILIPTTYLNNILDNIPKVFKDNIPMLDQQATAFSCYKKNSITSDNLTLNELLLGLKIDHCDNVQNPFTPEQVYQDAENQIEAVENFDWTELFVTRKDLGLAGPTVENYTQYQKTLLDSYKKNANDNNATIDVFEQYMFPWFIMLSGHGSRGENGHIASLTIKQFLNFINFLNFSVNTKLLFYTSCFAGGQHTDPTFQYVDQDAKIVFKKIPYNLNFVVAVGAITDASSYAPHLSISLFSKNTQKDKGFWEVMVDNIKFTIDSQANFAQFFSELDKYFTNSSDVKESDKKTLPDIINIVHNSFNLTNNIPLIRRPNTEWFKAIDINKAAHIIDAKTITKYTQQPKPFSLNKKALLIYETYIPIQLFLNTAYINIIPMNLTQKDYFFEYIKNYSNNPLPLSPENSSKDFNINYYVKTYEFTLTNNAEYPGELGNPKYNDKDITVSNFKSQGFFYTFTFIDDNKMPHYYRGIGNPNYSEFGSPKLLTNEKEIKEYKANFDKKEELVAKQYKDLKRKWQNISESIAQKIKTPDVQTLIDERKLINALNSLTESLNQLKTSF